MRTRIRTAAALIIAGTAGCTLSSTDEGNLPAGQQFLFEVEHVNFAWGLTWRGFNVDREGGVWAFQLDAPWEPAGNDRFTEDELVRKYQAGRVRIGQVDADRLLRMFAQARAAGAGPLSEPVQRCADAGAVSFRAWSFDPVAGRYAPVLLREEGDWARENRSDAAREVYAWLRSLGPGFGISGCEP